MIYYARFEVKLIITNKCVLILMRLYIDEKGGIFPGNKNDEA